ncbi:MAG: YihY/virulence factor BrkB family protein [Kineosporiaceae bacterium]
MSRLRALEQRWKASFAGRTWERYSAARGNVLAGGIAYFAFFSVLPALAVGFTALGLVLGDDSRLQVELAEYINGSIGTTVITVPGETGSAGIVSIDQLTRSGALTVSAVVGLLGLLVTGLGWIGATRQGIGAVFGRPAGGNLVLDKLRDAGVLATLGLAILVSAVGSVVVTTASNDVLGWLGLEGTTGAGTFVSLVSAAVIVGVDTVTFLVLFRWLSGVAVPVHHLWPAALAGGVALGLLKVSGGLLLDLLSGNRLVAAFSVVVGLLVWMNLVGRLTLVCASWAATAATDAGGLPGSPPATRPAVSGPLAAGVLAAGGPAAGDGRPEQASTTPRRTPTYGVRAADRTTLAAGVVLGVGAAAALRVARGAVRAVVGAVRD